MVCSVLWGLRVPHLLGTSSVRNNPMNISIYVVYADIYVYMDMYIYMYFVHVYIDME